MQASLDVSLTYGVSFIEIFQDDAVNLAFYPMILTTTLALGWDATGSPFSRPQQ